MSKKLLVISYTFPPYPGIGGRRWVKFAKYLAKRNYDVHVICSENPFNEQSLWVKDVGKSHLWVHTLPVNYPSALIHGAKNLFSKLQYKFWLAYLSIKSKGVILERTTFWEKQLLQKATQLIEKEEIQNVIVSIPPFRLGTYSLKLKERFPELNLIIDYRDPWSDNKSFHGFKDIKPSRLEYEENSENEVLTKADHVITVSEEMSANLKARCRNPEKIVTISNGFDPDDIGNQGAAHNGNILHFTYAGTLYSNLTYIIKPLLVFLKDLKEKQNALYTKCSFSFYGTHNKEVVDLIKSSGIDIISIYDNIPVEEMQAKLSASDFCMLMSAPDHHFAFNTKFMEYIANRKPILLFSYEGKVSQFLENNKLGFHISPDDFERDTTTFFSEIDNIRSSYNNAFDIEPYSVTTLTTQIEKLLK